MVFHWGLSHSKSSQVSRTLLGILADLYNPRVWMVSIHLPISDSSRALSNVLEPVPITRITIGITITLMFQNLFLFSGKVLVWVSLFTFFDFHSMVCWNGKIPLYSKFFFVNYHYCQTCLLLCFDLFIPTYPHVFFLPKYFCLMWQFLYRSFSPISHPGFVLLFKFLRSRLILSQTSFAPA